MSEITAILVDDEEAARSVLSNLLQRFCPSIKVLAHCEDVPKAVEAIKAHKPQVVFLDVQMPNYAGYELVEFFEEIDFEIIFTTAYDQYALKAFELSAIDYLLKPINRSRLVEAVEKLGEKLSVKAQMENYRVLLEAMKSQSPDKLVIAELGGRRVIPMRSVIAVEGQGAYSCLHLEDSAPLVVSKNLKHFESLLPEDKGFFRSHKSWIIQMNFVEGYNKGAGELKMKGDVEARLSKYRVEEFEVALQSRH
jgi:two-component system LytT family response regulator